MLKQCASPAEADTEEHAAVGLLAAGLEDKEEAASHNSEDMTTATSPPPPPPDTEQAQQRAGADADGPAAAAMEVDVVDDLPSLTDVSARLVCAVCDGVLATEAALAAHLQDLGLNHAGGGDELQGFGCRVCRRVFDHADTLDRHVLTHPGEQVFKCPLCGQALRTNGGLARHARRHLDGHLDLLRPDLAIMRGTATKRRKDPDDTDYEVEAKQMSPSSDGDAVPAAPAAVPAVPLFTCPVCPASNPFRAPYLPELEAHLEHSHRDYSVSCDLCGGTYRSVRDLNLHVHTAHRSGGKASRGRDVVGFKDLTFVDFSSRKFAHIARAECEKSLHRAASRLHPFQCECGLAFPCDSALAIHRQACPNTVYVDSPADLSHAGVGVPAQSPKGDFFAKLDLLNKATSPAGIGRLAPPAYLDRDLADIPSILSAASGAAMGTAMGTAMGHSSEHGEERDDHEEQQDAFAAEFRRMKQRGEFPCRLCTEVFPNLRALKGHNRVHMGPSADGYRCNMCPHAALDKVALQRHMRTHNGARPYECALCRFAFTTKANCERHLRNRHAKCSRDEVKSSIIYHPSEDPGNDPELQQQLQQHGKLDVKRSLFAEPMLEDGRRHSLDVGTMTASEDDEDQHRDEQDDPVDDEVAEDGRQSPLDLSMVLDLSKKRPLSPVEVELEDEVVPDEDMDEVEEQPQDLSRKASTESAAAPASHLHVNNQSTPLQSPEAALPFPGLSSLYVNPYQLGVAAATGQGLGQGLAPGLAPGLPFPAYYPGLLRSLQFGQLGQLGGGLVLEPMRLLQRPPFLPTAAPGDSAVPQGLTDVAKDEPACPASPKSERSMSSMSECPQQGLRDALGPSSGSSTASNGSSKLVMKNGVLMPKQKQRRYRTERPHVCEHCSARFTLSSNRERHVKHQHPQFWSQRHRGPSGVPPTPPTTPAPPTPMDASTPLRADFMPAGVKHPDEDDEDEGLVIDEERPSSEDHHHHDNGVEGDAEDDMHHASAAPSTPAAGEDLASVSKLLNNASIQTFHQFLREGDEAVVPSTPSVREPAAAGHPEEGLGSEEDLDEEGLVAGSPSEGNNSGSEQDKSESESAAAPMKKKSAYSMAPNRVSCPYCSRKFPWTSSLRRHVLTHTGQKPYKCLYCPLLFTTKSNCDRHLARKHSNKKDANSSSSGVSTLSTPNSSTASVSPGSSAGSGSSPEGLLALARPPALPAALSPPGQYPLRNVPERPYRCRHCPSSTFASLSNLRKHVATKHTGASLESCILPSDAAANVSGYESHGSVSDVEPAEDKELKAELEMKIPVFCPSTVLDQPLSLCKVERADLDAKLGKKEDGALNLRRPADLERLERLERMDRGDIMREAHNSLMQPISAPVVSIPEGSARPTESSINLSSSELPFKCHLCDGSFTERQECLDHIRLNHASEYDILLSKGALELNVNTSPEDNNVMEENHHADGENIEHIRGKFPDYANRKVMCAFCMRRFWSAEDLRRHMRTHTGERPFSCDVCRRRFTLKHSMLRHRKKHGDISNNNNNSISTPFVNSTGPEDLSPSATSGEEEGYHVNMTNHNNNNINVADVSKMYMAICDNRLNLKRNFRRNNFRRKEEENSGLISNLLGIGDPSIIDKVLLTKSADDAEKLLGVYKNGSVSSNGRT